MARKKEKEPVVMVSVPIPHDILQAVGCDSCHTPMIRTETGWVCPKGLSCGRLVGDQQMKERLRKSVNKHIGEVSWNRLLRLAKQGWKEKKSIAEVYREDGLLTP